MSLDHVILLKVMSCPFPSTPFHFHLPKAIERQYPIMRRAACSDLAWLLKNCADVPGQQIKLGMLSAQHAPSLSSILFLPSVWCPHSLLSWVLPSFLWFHFSEIKRLFNAINSILLSQLYEGSIFIHIFQSGKLRLKIIYPRWPIPNGWELDSSLPLCDSQRCPFRYSMRENLP